MHFIYFTLQDHKRGIAEWRLSPWGQCARLISIGLGVDRGGCGVGQYLFEGLVGVERAS